MPWCCDDWYILIDNETVRVTEKEFHEWFHSVGSVICNKIAADDISRHIRVRTFFYGRDLRRSPESPPVLFSTMIINDHGGSIVTFCASTFTQALLCHRSTVKIAPQEYLTNE